MLLLLPIAEFLLLPLAVSLRDAVINQISDRVVEGARGRVAAWLASFSGEEPAPDRAKLREQLANDPELSLQLYEALETIPGMPEIPATPTNLPRDATELLLEGYAEVLYQFALSAIWIGRPVAMEGFLQGDDWIAACQSQDHEGMLAFRDNGKPVFPDPSTIWERTSTGPERILSRARSYTLPDLEYRVRHVPDQEQRESEITELEERWRLDPSDVLPPRPSLVVREEDEELFAERWHLVTEIRPHVVPLPAAPLRDFPNERPQTGNPTLDASRRRLEGEQPLRPSEYHGEFRSLIKIHDGPAAIERMRQRLFAINSADQRLVAEVRAALGATTGPE